MISPPETVTVALEPNAARWTGTTHINVGFDASGSCAIAAADGAAPTHLDLTRPLSLPPLEIVKPWGREVWFSAIETRGVNVARQGRESVPLPWLLAAAPGEFGNVTAPVLAKRLEPQADRTLGELYFEVHSEKDELYLVTAIDAGLWPDGIGQVRLGLRSEAHEAQAADPWHRTRRALLDYRAACAALHGAPTVPDNADDNTGWFRQHRSAREAVDALTVSHPVQVGSIIRVPAGIPHALQAGVTVLEFQTPSYQRHILYSTQAVITEPDWSPADALPWCRPPEPTDHLITKFPEFGSSLLAEFDGFRVFAVHLGPNETTRLPAGAHGIIAVTRGTVSLGRDLLQMDSVHLLTGRALASDLRSRDETAHALVAVAKGNIQ